LRATHPPAGGVEPSSRSLPPPATDPSSACGGHPPHDDKEVGRGPHRPYEPYELAGLKSAFTSVPSCTFAELTVLLAIFADVTALLAIFAAVTAFDFS